MTKIYLIRHAEAEGNLYRRIQGHWDGSITPLGLQQIDALAQRFRRDCCRGGKPAVFRRETGYAEAENAHFTIIKEPAGMRGA